MPEPTYRVLTATQAKKRGLNPHRYYGYYVSESPKKPASTSPLPDEGIAAWCKTKGIATHYVEDQKRYEREGYTACPCGSGKQRRHCCGV